MKDESKNAMDIPLQIGVEKQAPMDESASVHQQSSAEAKAQAENQFKVTPKLEADKLMRELMQSSQQALIDMLRKSGVSADTIDEIEQDMVAVDESLPMTENYSWNDFLMSSEQQKERITQASRDALKNFQDSVKNQSLQTLSATQFEPVETMTPDMAQIMSGLAAQKNE